MLLLFGRWKQDKNSARMREEEQSWALRLKRLFEDFREEDVFPMKMFFLPFSFFVCSLASDQKNSPFLFLLLRRRLFTTVTEFSFSRFAKIVALSLPSFSLNREEREKGGKNSEAI